MESKKKLPEIEFLFGFCSILVPNISALPRAPEPGPAVLIRGAEMDAQYNMEYGRNN
jgi:hypothetical protein